MNFWYLIWINIGSLVCHWRFLVEPSFATKISKIRRSFSLAFVQEKLIFNFQGRKMDQKLLKFIIQRIFNATGVLSYADYAESDQQISFFAGNTWKILHFIYVGYECFQFFFCFPRFCKTTLSLYWSSICFGVSDILHEIVTEKW